ncbi:DUF4142 domain-containing protein [Sphingomonas bacterium]|uniref:DUF4142 domain-containing protein n=1 Tax=Sphingomonas bacterium TaxID=1895847 RepID=UPI001C2CFCD6|nr:DUF4142 domain-containing protein [Sphingomonas bacterium]
MHKVMTGLLAIAAAGSAAASPEAGSKATRDYVQAAGQSDAFEMLEADTALTGSGAPQVRGYAERMIRDHAKTGQALRKATDRSGLTPPPMGIGEDQARLLGALQSLKQPEFDRTYWRHQMLGHRSALTAARDYAASGDDPAVRQVAAASVPVILAHLATAQKVLASLGER